MTNNISISITDIVRSNAPKSPSEAQWTAQEQRINALQEQGLYQEALDICLEFTDAHPEIADAWLSAAVSCHKLRHPQDAIKYAQTALTHNSNRFEVYDVLAFSHGVLGQWDEVRRYGLQALDIRDRQFGGKPVIPPPEPGPMPPPPSAQTRERNIIAFSLFGGDSKYCETAVLNVQEQPQVYPHWVCRFYVDGSVPESVISRLRAGGAQIVPVNGPAAHWPGAMWRFLALDDPQAHRILLRDADSVISQREANAVGQWLTSGKRFHVMRDEFNHFELILAGIWGAVGSSLPPMAKLMQYFMSAPLEARRNRCADQFFLRQYVWPYARASLMQHDSVFGFMDTVPFPDEERPKGFHVGCTDSQPEFAIKSDLPNGSEVTWGLYRIEKLDNGQTQEGLVCTYPATVQDGALKAHIPGRYARWIQQGTALIRLIRNSSTAAYT